MMFGVSLGLTIVMELIVVFLFTRLFSDSAFDRCCERQKKQKGKNQNRKDQSRKAQDGKTLAILIILVNLLTNPPAVLVCWLGSLYLPFPARLPLELAVETGVIAVEAGIYRSFAKQPGWRIPKPVLLAAAANLCSWAAGRIL